MLLKHQHIKPSAFYIIESLRLFPSNLCNIFIFVKKNYIYIYFLNHVIKTIITFVIITPLKRIESLRLFTL
jgi:hypothetical protein